MQHSVLNLKCYVQITQAKQNLHQLHSNDVNRLSLEYNPKMQLKWISNRLYQIAPYYDVSLAAGAV